MLKETKRNDLSWVKDLKTVDHNTLNTFSAWDNFATDTHICSTVSTYRIVHCSYYSLCSWSAVCFVGKTVKLYVKKVWLM